MLQLSLSIGPQEKVVAVGKGPQILSLKKYDSEQEDEDPLPSGALARLLNEKNLKSSDVARVRVLDPAAQSDPEKSSWLKNLRRDWGLRSNVRSFFRSQLSPRLEVEFVHPEKARLSYLSHRLESESCLVWSFSSENQMVSESLWVWRNQRFYRQGSQGQGTHSIEAFFRSAARFCGFDGPEGLEKFLELSHLGEPSFLSELLNELVRLDEMGHFEYLHLDSEFGDGSLIENGVEALESWFGVNRRSEDAPISTRELDLAASLMELLHQWIFLKIQPWLSVSDASLPLVLVGQSPFVRFVELELQRRFPQSEVVQWSEHSEAEMEALGALSLDENVDVLEPSSQTPLQQGSAAL